MRWGKRKRSRQQNHYISRIGVESRHQLRDRLLRGTIVVIVGLFLVLGVVTTGWGFAVYAVPALQTGTVAIVGSSGAHMFATPGGVSIADLTPGTVVTAVGRADNNLWVVVRGGEGLSGWLEVRELTLFGLDQLPVMLNTEPPGAAPTLVAPPTATPVAQAPAPTQTAVPAVPAVAVAQAPAVSATAVPASPSPLSRQPTFVAVVRQGESALYDRPNGTLVERLIPGTAITAQGRTEDGLWLAVTIPKGSSGWAQSAALIIANLAEIPVFDPSTGLPVPTPEAAAQTSSPGVMAEAGTSEDPAASSTDPTIDPTNVTATVNVGNSRLNIRSGPSTDFKILGHANHADILDVVGRNTAATWVQVITPGIGDGVSWVSADYVILSQSILGLADVESVSQPVVVVISPPTPETAPTPANVIPIGDIGCKTDQIAKWDGGQGVWVCSDALAQLQADVASLRIEIEALRTEISALRASLAVTQGVATP